MTGENHLAPHRVERLMAQIRWITRISVALTSTVHVEDVYSVLISGLISPLGMGFSHVSLFEIGAIDQIATGKYSLGIDSPEEAEELRAELLDEMDFIERRREELYSRSPDPEVEQELRTLELGAQWVTLFQRLGPDNPRTQEISRLSFSIVPDPGLPLDLFQQASVSKAPFALTKSKDLDRIPDELLEFLPEHFAIVPLRTSQGLQALLIVDMRWKDEPIDEQVLEAFDWFGTQGALAIQNARLIEDLEKAYNELKTVDQLKSNFLSIVSHELRTPLTAITGFVELVLGEKAGAVNDAQRNLLGRVAKNTGHLNNMVNDLIEIAEIEAEGLHDVQMEAVDPLDTLFKTIPKLEYRRRDKKVHVDPIFDDIVPHILTDARALERIYFHLLDNAVKFSESTDQVVVRFERRGQNHLSISIEDQGVGIPADKLQRIFEQFYQIENSLTRSREGLGLGLAVTRMLVQATRGEIEVESTVDKGSTFRLIYPIAPNSYSV
ncbi:MAG: HAMP domain-containing sensor histidine kinase [Sumerlaeia bacterium]